MIQILTSVCHLPVRIVGMMKFRSPLVAVSSGAVSRNMSEEEVLVGDGSADEPVEAPVTDEKPIIDISVDDKSSDDIFMDETSGGDSSADEKPLKPDKNMSEEEVLVGDGSADEPVEAPVTDEKPIIDISVDDKSSDDLFMDETSGGDSSADEKPLKPDKVEEDEVIPTENLPASTIPNDSQKDEKEIAVPGISGISKLKQTQKSLLLSNVHKSILAVARAPKSKRKSRPKELLSSDAQNNKLISIELRCTYGGKESVPTKAIEVAYKDWSLSKNVLEEYEKLDDQGTWIECIKMDCCKWRFVPTVHDPLLVPKDWECSMNPGRDHRTCSDPEVLPDKEEGKRLVLNEFTAGSLVWAQQIGYPWWPSLVDFDPDCVSYYLNCSQDVEDMSEVWYHVTFIDPLAAITRAWIKRSRVMPFHSSMPQQRLLKLSKSSKKYEKRIKVASQRANELEPLTLGNRLRLAGFVKTCLENEKVSSQFEELPATCNEQPLMSQENDGDSSDGEDLYISRLVQVSQDSKKSLQRKKSLKSIGGVISLKKGSRSSENDDHPSQKSKIKSKKQSVSPQSKNHFVSPLIKNKLSSQKAGEEFKKQYEIPQSKNVNQMTIKQKSLNPKKSDTKSTKSQKQDKIQQSQKQSKSPVKPKNLTLQKNSLNPMKKSKSLQSRVQRSESPLKQDILGSQKGAKQSKKSKNASPRNQKDLEQETSSQMGAKQSKKQKNESPRKQKDLEQETSSQMGAKQSKKRKNESSRKQKDLEQETSSQMGAKQSKKRKNESSRKQKDLEQETSSQMGAKQSKKQKNESPLKQKDLLQETSSQMGAKQSKKRKNESPRKQKDLEQETSSQMGAKQSKKQKNESPCKQKDLEQETSSQQRSDKSKKASGSPRKRKSSNQETNPPRKRVAKLHKGSKETDDL